MDRANRMCRDGLTMQESRERPDQPGLPGTGTNRGGKKNRREPEDAPSGGRVIEKQLETYCDVMARNTRRPSPRWGACQEKHGGHVFMGDPKENARHVECPRLLGLSCPGSESEECR